MKEGTLRFKRGIFTALFSAAAIFALHPLTVLYPTLGMSAFTGGVCAFAGALLANRVLWP